MVWSLIGLTAFSVVYGFTAKLDSSISTTGQLRPKGGVSEVMTPFNTLVDRVLVKEGQKVKAGDLLVVFAGVRAGDASLRAAVAAAHEQELSVVLLTGGDPGGWPDLLAETDVWIPVASARAARARELHLLALHALCDAIDIQLLGDDGPE